MRALAWILLAALPALAQTGARDRVLRRANDRTANPAVTEPDPNAKEGAAPRGAGAFRRYAVVLEQAPVTAAVPNREAITGAVGRAHRQRVVESQAGVRAELSRRGLREIGSAETLVNAVFVSATVEDATALAGIPGVRYVREMRPVRMAMTKANEVVKSPAAWAQLGGQSSAGAGVKIAIIDSGIDISHPSMQDLALTMPAGFPKCSGAECNYTNSKVIAARSFVDRLVYAYPNDTRPDDISPRDRSGHGTAAASVAAGAVVDTPLGRMSGVAPRAQLGNYKVFGSPGVNDFAFDDVIIAALEAALLDGMDIASLSLGGPSLWGPDDRGSVCDNTGTIACDLQVEAVENAIRRGMTVVVSAGNDGDSGVEIPSLNTISSPGTAPSAITVGASVNSHILYQSLRVPNGPGSLARLNAYFGDGPKPARALQAPLRDVTKLQNDGKACTALGTGTLAGAIALIARGDCPFATKVNNAQKAGAVAVVLYQTTSSGIFAPTGLRSTTIPLVMISKTDGPALQQYVASNPDAPVVLDPAVTAVDAPAGEVSVFSSQGPATGTNAIKPELIAVGQDLYMATQKYDPNGELFDPTGFVRADGTSFSTPMVAGAAALVKQRNRNWTPAQIKSALVHSANFDIGDYDYDGKPIDALQSGMGGGQLDVDMAVRANVVADPATVSFGTPTAFPLTNQIRLANMSTGTVNLRFSVSETIKASGVTLSVTPATATVGVNQVATVTLRLDGARPTAANWYEGYVVVDGGATQLRIPYGYLIGDNTAFNAFPLTGSGFTAVVNGRASSRLGFKVVDKQGVPVSNLPVRFRSEVGGGRVDTVSSSSRTDSLGIADAVVFAGPTLGEQVFSVEAGGLRVEWVGKAIQQPAIQTGGVVNAASGQAGSGVAPGSYISIFGAALADATLVYSTTYLPLSLATVSVGFDVPGRTLSYPGRIHFVSPGQINVQVPWELAGLPSVDMKVSVGDYSSAIFRVALNDYSPAVFEYTDPGSGRLLTAALDQRFGLVTSANPVRRGEAVQIYANGIGPVDNQPVSGEPASTIILSNCRTAPEVTIGGRPAQVLFCGLAPGFVGLYQINATVPADAPTGIQPLEIRSGGVTSKTASLPVQ